MAWAWLSVSICATLLGRPFTFSGMVPGMKSYMSGMLVRWITGRVQAVHMVSKLFAAILEACFACYSYLPETGFGMATSRTKSGGQAQACMEHKCWNILAVERLERLDICSTGSRIVVKPLPRLCELHASSSRMKFPESNLLHSHFCAKFWYVTCAPCALKGLPSGAQAT